MFESLWKWIKKINKKVWVTAALLATIFIIGTTWIVVSNVRNAFKPANWVGLDQRQRQTVSGNGGPAVMVGNWLYFVGGYVDTTTIRYRQNEHNNVTDGAIYRVYIGPSEGTPLYENADRPKTDPNFTLHLLDKAKQAIDDTGKKARPYQIIVPKIAGFDQAALWVFDKHLVYTSPNNNKDKYGELQISKIDFFRVDLDGKNHRKIYTTSNESLTTSNFTVASYAGEVFLLIKDGEMLRRVSVNGKNAGKVSTVTKRAKSVSLPEVTSYHRDYYQDAGGNWQVDQGSLQFDLLDSYRGIMSHVYYTEEFSEDEQKIGLSGTRIIQYNVKSGEKIEVPLTGYEVSVLALANGRLMYTAKAESESSMGLYMSTQTLASTNTEPFDIAPKTNGAKFLDDFEILAAHYYDSGEVVYLPTVATPNVAPRFVTLADSRMSIYIQSAKRPDVPHVQVNETLSYIQIDDVSRIITVTGGAVHYLDTTNAIKAVDLNNGEAIEYSGNLSPETKIRPWVIALPTSRGQAVWYFHIKSFSVGEYDHDDHTGHDHGDDSTTCAMLSDLAGNREFILGRIDCKFTNNPEDCCE